MKIREDWQQLHDDVQSARKEIIYSRINARLFLDKQREAEEKVREEVAYKQSLNSGWASLPLEQRWVIDCFIAASNERLIGYEAEIKKFKALHDIALGHSEEKKINLDALKNIDPRSLLGLPERATRQNLLFHCPLHTDNTPSFFWWFPGKFPAHFKCFSCQEHGDIIQLYQLMNGCTFIEACKELQKLA